MHRGALFPQFMKIRPTPVGAIEDSIHRISLVSFF
jgi:hypothetical protein